MPRKWLESLDEAGRAKAERLIEQLAALGCPDPGAWARRELRDDLPQRSRYALLRALWTEAINAWRDSPIWVENLAEDRPEPEDDLFPEARRAVARIVAAGVPVTDIAELARFVAYETTFSVVHTLDEGFDPSQEGELPGWAVVERDALGHLTPRVLARLHVDLARVGPEVGAGRAGED
jgi:hypothetical protein